MATAPKATGASKRDLLEVCKKQGISFLRLQFTDILGINKNVEVPESQFEKALEGDIMFDGSSIEGSCGSRSRTCAEARPGDVSRPSVRRRGRARRAAHLRHLQPRRLVVRGCTRQALKRQITKAKGLATG